MLSSRSRAASRRSALIRSLATTLETLERRAMLHAGHESTANVDALIDRGLPTYVAQMFHDGHINVAQYESLPPEVKNLINPHEVEDNPTDGPIDYDAIMGIPLYPDGPPMTETGEGADLPDFFPQLDSSITVDQTSQSGRTLLRFGTQVNNQGTGPASLISGRPGVDPIPSGAPITSWVNPDGSQNVLQGVYTFNGSSFQLSYYRNAGLFTYHAGHGHFHFDGYAFYRLRHNNGGTPGAYVTRPDGSTVVGTKTGFCLINTSSSFTMENGQSSTTIPGYGASGQPTMSCGLLQGVRVGSADEYSSGLEGQWIDVTGVPNGQYFVEIQLDGENAVLESNENNNAKNYAYTLNVNNPSGGIAPDVFDTVTSTNNTLATAEDMGVMGTFNQTGLTIHFGQDFDWFKFVASSSGNQNISATGTNGNLDLYLYDSTGAQLRAATGTGSSETVSYPFVAGETYYVKAEAYNSTTVSNYQINWQLKPTVTNAASDTSAGEAGSNSGAFEITRNGPTTSPLSVSFVLGGTAVRDVDYTVVADNLINPTTISIGDLQSVATITIVPISDALIEATETVTLTVNGNTAYVIGGASGATINLHDTPPAVTADAFTFETLPQQLSFDFTLDVSASLAAGDVVLLNRDLREEFIPDSVSYNAALNRATFSVNSVLPDGNYVATIAAGGVTHALGEPLAQDVVATFFVFAGDANHDRTVNISDFSALAANFNQPGTFSQGNFNYDAAVDLSDFAVLASRFNTSLPQARRAPVATGTTLSAQSALPPRSPFAGSRIDAVIEELELSSSPDVI